MLEWVVIGGGIQGTHLALVLVEECGVPRDRLRIVDPHPLLCERWRQLAENTGMSYLRSPAVHHLGLRSFSIDAFVRTDAGRPHRRFIPPYNRPATRLFNAHALSVIKGHALESLHLMTRASGLRAEGDGPERVWHVRTPQGDLAARRVLIAFGHTEQPRWPDWAVHLAASERPIRHVFDDHFRRKEIRHWEHIAVVGGGLSGATLALTLAEAGQGRVTLITRGEIRVEQFDSDPGWLGPKLLAGFWAEHDYVKRREMVDAARNRGTVPPDVAEDLRRALREGRLAHVVAPEIEAMGDGPGGIALRLAGERFEAERIILATGLEKRRPGSPWMDRVIDEHALPVAPCGYPILKPDLEWVPGLYAAGAFAELELGPSARNIAGARSAAERLVQTHKSRLA